MKILLYFIYITFYFQKINSIDYNFLLLNDKNENFFSPSEFLQLNQEALLKLSEFLTSLINKNNNEFKICLARIGKSLSDMKIDNLLYYSGHDFFDLGNNNLCIENDDYFYVLILFKTILNSSSEKYDEQLKAFRSNELSNVGICFWQKKKKKNK